MQIEKTKKILLACIGLFLVLGLVGWYFLITVNKNQAQLRVNEKLISQQNSEIGDYYIFADEDGYKKLMLTVRALETVTKKNGDFFLPVSISKNIQLNLLLGDSKNKLFYSQKNNQDSSIKPNFISIEPTKINENIPGKIIVVTIPLFNEALENTSFTETCKEYCQNNIKKIKKHNNDIVNKIINAQNRSVYRLIKTKKIEEFGPVIEILQYND